MTYMITFIYFFAQSLASFSSSRIKQWGGGGGGGLLDHGNNEHHNKYDHNNDDDDEKNEKIDYLDHDIHDYL